MGVVLMLAPTAYETRDEQADLYRASAVLVEKLTPAALLETIQQERATVMIGAPTFMRPFLKKATKDKDEEVKFCGALGLLALKQKDGLALVMERCRTDWPSARQLIGEVLPAARCTSPSTTAQ